MVDAYAAKMEFYRDAECTKVLDEWPEDASKSQLRSPKHIFGQRDPIYVSVTGLPTDQLDGNGCIAGYAMSFTSPSSADECVDDVPLVMTGTSKAKTAMPVYLSTITAKNNPFPGYHLPYLSVKVVDEEDLIARLHGRAATTNPTLLEKRVMVDRGEYTAVAGNEVTISVRPATGDFNAGLQAIDAAMATYYQWKQNGYQEGKCYSTKQKAVNDSVHSNKALELLHNACDITENKSPADIVCYAGHAGGNLSVVDNSGAPLPNLYWGASNPPSYWDENAPNFSRWNSDVDFLAITACEVLGDSAKPDRYIAAWNNIFSTKLHAILATSDTMRATESDEWHDFITYASGHGNIRPCTVVNAWKYAFLAGWHTDLVPGYGSPYGILVRKANLDDYLLSSLSDDDESHVLTADVTEGSLLYFWYKMRNGVEWVDLDPNDATEHHNKRQQARNSNDSISVALTVSEERQDLRRWRNGKAAVRLNRGFAIWNADHSTPVERPAPISDERAIVIADEFIHENGGLPTDAKRVQVGSIFMREYSEKGVAIGDSISQGTTIVYGHNVNGAPIRDDSIRVTVSNDEHVVHYLRKWRIMK